MENEELNIQEKQLKKKQKGRMIKRGILIVLNALLSVYLVYSVSNTVVDYINKTTQSSKDIITINGLSETKSLEKYKEAIDYNESTSTFETINAIDYVYYGGYLNFRNSNDTINSDGSLNVSSYNRYVLRNLSNDVKYTSTLDFSSSSYLNDGIPLFSPYLTNGDYIVYPYAYTSNVDSKKTPLKIESEELLIETFYTPLKDGVRKKIELKSKSTSPCLVLSIRVVPTLTENVDIAVLTSEENKINVDNVLKNTNYLYDYVIDSNNDKENLINMYNKKGIISVVVENGNDIVMSNYVNYENINKPTLIQDGYLKGLDDDIYIRELGGDIFLSGKGYSYKNNENAYLTQYINGNNNGSVVIKIGIERIYELPNLLEKIF